MVSYFPIPFPDETFYSLVCRYAFIIGETSPLKVNEQLFGKRKIQLSYEFPNRLADFIRHVSHLSTLTSESVIANHSSFDFYKYFITPTHADLVKTKMISGTVGNINGFIGLNRSDLRPLDTPRYCIKCAESDIIQFGQVYWHRLHQLVIPVCPIHKLYLTNLATAQVSLRSQQYYYTFSKEGLDSNAVPCFNSLLLEMAELSSHLLNNKASIGVTKEFYNQALNEKGFYRGKRVMIDKLIQSIVTQFGEAEISQWKDISNIKLPLLESIQSMIYKGDRIFNPARHLLLNLFLQKFPGLEIREEISFGSGPWLCYNKASDHFLQPIIEDAQIKYSTKHKQRVGIFKCKCGMVYMRYRRLNSKVNKEVTWVTDYGEEWHTKFKKAYEYGLSNGLLAKEFGVSVTVVKNAIKKYSKTVTADLSTASNTQEIKAKFREMWERCLKEGNGKSPTEVRKLLPNIYYWLSTYDRDWLRAINISFSVRRAGNQMRINWNQVDKQTLEKLKEAYQSLLISQHTKRITKTLLFRMVSRFRYVTSQRHISQLPKSKRFIEDSVESESQYQLRRIKIAFEAECVDEVPSYSRVVRSSGIKNLLPETKTKLTSMLGMVQ